MVLQCAVAFSMLAAALLSPGVIFAQDTTTPDVSGQSSDSQATEEPTATPTLTETPTDVPTVADTEVPTEVPTEVVPTEEVTTAPTDVPTDVPTEIPTEISTEITPTPEATLEPTATPPRTDQSARRPALRWETRAEQSTHGCLIFTGITSMMPIHTNFSFTRSPIKARSRFTTLHIRTLPIAMRILAFAKSSQAQLWLTVILNGMYGHYIRQPRPGVISTPLPVLSQLPHTFRH